MSPTAIAIEAQQAARSVLIRALALIILAGAVPLASQADDAPLGKKLALLVGVKEYNHAELPNLRFPEHDVEDLAELLRRQNFKVVLLTTSLGKMDPQVLPTRANIQRSLRGLLEGVTKRDLIVVGLAGHGIQPLGSDFSYFCPMDANPTTKAGKEPNSPNVVDVPDSLVSIDELLENLRNSGVGQKLLLVDACRNDPKVRGRRGVEQVRIQSLPPETGVLLSCSAGQFAFEHESWGKRGNGAFFSQVVKGFSGEAADETGAVTWETLAIYVRKRVPRIVDKVYGKDGGEQRPNEIKNFSGDFMALANVIPPKPGAGREAPKVDLATTTPAVPPNTPANPVDLSDPFFGKAGGSERNDNLLQLKLVWCPAGKVRRPQPDPGESPIANAGTSRTALDQANSQLMILEGQMRRAFKSQLSNRNKRAEYERRVKEYEAQKKLVQSLSANPQPTGTAPPRTAVAGEITIPVGYWIGKYEVTQQEWEKLMRSRPWQKQLNVKEGEKFPATWITWESANLFCKRFTEVEHRAKRLPIGWRYTLPTEAQWEYSCRAKVETPFSFGRDELNLGNFAWFKDNADGAQEDYAHTVGGKNPNGWGLFDMHGNVAEWCIDVFATEPNSHTGTHRFSQRVIRGGAWNSPAAGCQIGERSGHPSITASSAIGFRVVASLVTEPVNSGE